MSDDREQLWLELERLYRKAIQELSGLHVAHGARQLGTDEDITRGFQLRALLGITSDSTGSGAAWPRR